MIARIRRWLACQRLERITRERRDSYEIRRYAERRAAAKLGHQRRKEGMRA
jgi:hypothetical protein